MGIPYPVADESLGELLYPNEEFLANQIANEIEYGLRKQYSAGNARRDVHAKLTGCLNAEFRINESIPNDLAKGIFIPGNIYQAYIRFSNASGDPTRSDDNEDTRGMAIKLLDIPGEKVLENNREARTQDFMLINHPVFLTNDPKKYLSLIQKSSGNFLQKLSIPITLGLKGTLIAKRIGSGKISNPMQIRYFSAVAYQLGTGSDRQAVKYSVKPSIGKIDSLPHEPGHDYLREAIKTELTLNDITMKFLIQPRTDETMSVEDSMTEWNEVKAPFYEVATIHIPKQNFDTPERDQFGERLSFSPWHTLPTHKPLGCVNRMRKTVYERISKVRHAMNSVERKEPN